LISKPTTSLRSTRTDDFELAVNALSSKEDTRIKNENDNLYDLIGFQVDTEANKKLISITVVNSFIYAVDTIMGM
jgi:hypothetical protein